MKPDPAALIEYPTAEEVIYALDAGLCVNCQDDAAMPRQVERAVTELILAAKAIRATVKILKLPPHPGEIDRLIRALQGKRINRHAKLVVSPTHQTQAHAGRLTQQATKR